MDSLIVLVIVVVLLAAWLYSIGKRLGSHKGREAGRNDAR